LKAVVVGLRIQGYKRREHAGDDIVASVDPVNTEADLRDIQEIPLEIYDTVVACVPDEPKVDLLRYCLGNQNMCWLKNRCGLPKPNKFRNWSRLPWQTKLLAVQRTIIALSPTFLKCAT
jgi:hypothetical protein